MPESAAAAAAAAVAAHRELEMRRRRGQKQPTPDQDRDQTETPLLLSHKHSQRKLFFPWPALSLYSPRFFPPSTEYICFATSASHQPATNPLPGEQKKTEGGEAAMGGEKEEDGREQSPQCCRVAG